MLQGHKPKALDDMKDDCQQRTSAETQAADHEDKQVSGQQVTSRVDQLIPHPSFARHRLNVPISAISVAASQANLALREPIVITSSVFRLSDEKSNDPLAQLAQRESAIFRSTHSGKTGQFDYFYSRGVDAELSKLPLAFRIALWITGSQVKN